MILNRNTDTEWAVSKGLSESTEVIQTLNIIGSGGHSKVVIDALLAAGANVEIKLWDSNESLNGKRIMSLSVTAPLTDLQKLKGFVHLAIGNNQIRYKIGSSLPGFLSMMTIVHPRAIIAATAEIASGVFIAANAILAPDVHVGQGAIINHAAVVDHEVRVGAYSHIAPNATLGGNVEIAERVMIGSGAVVLPGIRIANDAIIGSGAVVVRDVTAHTTVKGVPAR